MHTSANYCLGRLSYMSTMERHRIFSSSYSKHVSYAEKFMSQEAKSDGMKILQGAESAKVYPGRNKLLITCFYSLLRHEAFVNKPKFAVRFTSSRP